MQSRRRIETKAAVSTMKVESITSNISERSTHLCIVVIPLSVLTPGQSYVGNRDEIASPDSSTGPFQVGTACL